MLLFLLNLVFAADIGSWSHAGSTGTVAIHTMLLPNMKLLTTERPHMKPYGMNPNTGGMLSAEIDLLHTIHPDGTWTAHYTPLSVRTNPFCAGHAQLTNGSIIVVGGDNQSSALWPNSDVFENGLQSRRIFDPCTDSSCTTGSWSILPDMTTSRWYPTLVTLPDNSVMIFGGQTRNIVFEELDKAQNDNPTYEYWPSKSPTPIFLPILNWAYPHNLYPMAFLLPSGNVFLFVSNKSITIDPKSDIVTNLPDLPAPDAAAVAADPTLDHAPWIYPHTATMTYLPMTIKNGFKTVMQVCGGSYYEAVTRAAKSSSMCFHFNPDDENPTWVRAPDMITPRVMPDSAILPDGTILYVNGAGAGQAGGDQGQCQYASLPVFAADLYNPDTNTWTSMAPASNIRLYHSGVLLLPTGHAMTMGSEMNNYADYWVNNLTSCWPYAGSSSSTAACTDAFNYNLERFTPPYLQRAARDGRPVIKQAPATITHNSSFYVEMETDPKLVKRVTFIRYSTTTHQTNTDQRFIELHILGVDGSKLVVQSPDQPNRAPGGNWMLWCLDGNGVPSVAATVLLQNGDPTAVTGYTPLSTSAASNHLSCLGILVSLILLVL